MKKTLVMLLSVCLLLSGCSVFEEVTPFIEITEKVFSVEGYGLQVTADSSFTENTGGSFDLQITDGDSYISIMAYKYIDLPEDTTPLDVYDAQNEDLISKRTAVTVIEEAETQGDITQALYSAEKDGVKNYYGSYLVDFPQEETFAWVLVTAAPSNFERNREYLEDIVFSITPVA